MNIAVVMMLLLFASPDAAQADTAAATPPEAAKKQTDGRQICRVTTTTGSRLAQKKTCGTRAEWAIIHREEKDNLNTQVIGGAACSPKGAPC